MPVLGRLAAHARDASEAARIRARYRSLLVPLADERAVAGRGIIEIATHRGPRPPRRTGGAGDPEQQTDGVDTFLVEDDVAPYRYRVFARFAAANAVPQSRAGEDTRATAVNDIKPSECSTLNLAPVVSGAGTVSGGDANELVTAAPTQMP